ncbi:MAG TPA: hypothetical protein VF737_10510 [Gemmatimonadaceae bacterium]
MIARNRAGQVVVASGSGLLFASAALHFYAGHRLGFPALAASNLAAAMQSAFRVVFLSVAWHWIVLGVVALVAAFTAGPRRRTLILICGSGVLIEAVAGAAVMGVFIGNEMIGTAAILMIIGGSMLEGADG